ncbi:lysophospholipid acyltransferase family protein [Waddlia chondrophila]|uniref:Putative 1-acyl-sn-glycerol-3-phosphate acyltransferase n=1 Tax=Waddlia chondrophila (strain ATCC VR-1470 / WSU 86-1044) TaxID=716544 RepID=D6YU73_WADCW|nr:lysophospholipid acyltransferase family protein [Waddlia chondrophila]ADI37684.1 putative 1-acyl-sn-glycerol-3-phosphate acyltransferase [Waddlia chondrophila WSU 86-1044]
MSLLYKTTHTFLRIFFRIFYRHRILNADKFVQGPAIIAPNHISFLDPPLVGASCPEPVAFLARETLFSKPFLGTLIRKLNAYPVSGKIKDLSSMKVVLNILKDNKKVMIFPEGIRSHDGELAEIKPGICMLAMRAQVPIIPVYIQGTFEIWNRQRKFPKLWGKTCCIFGEPIYPDTFKEMDKKSAQEAMALEIKKRILLLKKSL